MDKTGLYNHFFRAASSFTDIFPRAGANVLDRTVLPIAGSDLLAWAKVRDARRIVGNIDTFDKILVVSDLNIGDALFAQALVSGLRDFFPAANVDLVVNRVAAAMVEGNSEIDNVLPVFSGRPVPTREDVAGLARTMIRGRYDFTIIISPFISPQNLPGADRNVIDFSSFATVLLNTFRRQGAIAHVVYQLYRFIYRLFKGLIVRVTERDYKGVTVRMPASSVDWVADFLRRNNLDVNDKIVMIKPDTSSRFTVIPVSNLVRLVKRISRMDCRILLGSGHLDTEIENEIAGRLTRSEASAVTMIPPMLPIEVYSSLVDSAGVFISGDSGPLHIAAAWKYTREDDSEMRNHTSIVSVFGATPARIYAYDSNLPGFFPANQDAPSHAFVSESPCRNITCINKLAKTCRHVRCFESLDIDSISSAIRSAIEEPRATLETCLVK